MKDDQFVTKEYVDKENKHLKEVWDINHRALIDRYELSEDAKALAKNEVDRHFEFINGLQSKLDKQAETFCTKGELYAVILSIFLIFMTTFIAHIFGKL
jgi:hypothetical protein